MSEAAFAKAYAFIRKWEGGDSLPRPGDPNPTRAGITEATDDRLERAYRIVEKPVLARDDAEIEMAYRILWLESQSAWLPDEAAIAHFDAVINCGQTQAVRFLQRALGLTADGVLGPKTIAAMQGAGEGRNLAVKLTGLRVRFYRDLVAAKPDKARWLNGWLNRVSDLQKAVGL